MVVKQSEPVRLYTGANSYKACMEYFERICVCDDWKSPRSAPVTFWLLWMVPPPKLYVGLRPRRTPTLHTFGKPWPRFGFVDEPERAVRRFDVRKQLEEETLAVSEQNFRMLHREAWVKTDIKSPEADSVLRRKFVDKILDIELQKYLRLRAASDDFVTTVIKAGYFVDASELSRTAKKPAIRTTSTVNYQTIVDGVVKAVLHNQGRAAEINVIHAPNPKANAGFKNKKVTHRQGSPARSDMSTGSSSRASSTGRSVRFQDQEDNRSGNQGYGYSGRSRWP